MIALLLLACRAEPEAPDYPARAPWDRAGEDFYADPLAPGEERLSIGLFYEGEATELVPLDDSTTHFYVYEGTVGVQATDTRWEGLAADRWTRGELPWWGAGVHWDTPRDLTEWDSLHLVVSTDVAPTWSVGVQGGGVEARVAVADYGLVADGDWHVLDIPLSDLAGADLSAVGVALLLVGEAGAAGDSFVLDGVYFRRGVTE
jgi:hypothetical protein